MSRDLFFSKDDQLTAVGFLPPGMPGVSQARELTCLDLTMKNLVQKTWLHRKSHHARELPSFRTGLEGFWHPEILRWLFPIKELPLLMQLVNPSSGKH